MSLIPMPKPMSPEAFERYQKEKKFQQEFVYTRIILFEKYTPKPIRIMTLPKRPETYF